MTEAELQDLLKTAEPTRPTGEPLVDAVRGKLLARRKRRTTVRALSLGFIALGLIALLLSRPQRGEVAVREPLKPPEVTVADLERAVADQESLVAALLERESAAKVQHRLELQLAARGRIPSEKAVGETAAKLVVELADVIRENEGRQAEARETYAGVMQNFPETQAARTAKVRLLAMGGL